MLQVLATTTLLQNIYHNEKEFRIMTESQVVEICSYLVMNISDIKDRSELLNLFLIKTLQ